MQKDEQQEADEFQELIEALGDYFSIVQLRSDKVLGILINKQIAIGQDSVIDTGLYALDTNVPYNIFKFSLDATDSNMYELEKIINNTDMGLTFYQLIVDIYTNETLEDDLRQLIKERFIDDLESAGQLQKVLTPEYIPHAIKRPTSYSIQNSPINNKLVNNFFSTEELDGKKNLDLYPVGKGNNKQTVQIFVALKYMGADIKLNRKIGGFDKAVYNAISTLWSAGNACITVKDIYETMNGLKKSKKLSEAQERKIRASVDKMRFTNCYIDFSQELNAIKGESDIESGKLSDNMLHISEAIAVMNNGETKNAYKIHTEPVLYTYNRIKRQLISVPIGLLDTSQALSNTDDVIALREYLIQQIQNMKKGIRNSNKMLFDTIYKEAGIKQTTNRTQIMRDRDKVIAILEAWKDKQYIKGYELTYSGKSINGVCVKL